MRGWSEYNNWQIRLKGTTPEQVGVLCISKGRGNRAGIFKGPWYFRELKRNEQIRDVLKLIDFENWFAKCLKDRHLSTIKPVVCPRIKAYKDLCFKILQKEEDAGYWARQANEVDLEIERLLENKERYIGYQSQSTKQKQEAITAKNKIIEEVHNHGRS